MDIFGKKAKRFGATKNIQYISLFLFCSPEAITPPSQPVSDCHLYVAIAGREKGKWQKSQREKAKDCDYYS
jgi:hypothetical protein